MALTAYAMTSLFNTTVEIIKKIKPDIPGIISPLLQEIWLHVCLKCYLHLSWLWRDVFARLMGTVSLDVICYLS